MSFKWDPEKEDHDPAWDKYFMGIALLCEKRSKDDDRQVGACVVNDEPRVIGTGYNGMPLDCRDRLMPWKDTVTNPSDVKEKLKHDYVCHAELNAIVNKDPKSVKGCTVFVTFFPCNECAKIIVRSGIKRVVYLSNEKATKDIFKASRTILENAKIACQKFSEFSPTVKVQPPGLVLDFGVGDKVDGQSRTHSSNHGSVERFIISWEQYFMALAKLSAEVRSSTPKEGVCIVNKDKRIVGLGYVQDTLVPSELKPEENRDHYVIHAPINAIVSTTPTSLRDCTMYVTHFPCNKSAKVIVQSGIRKIVHLEEIEEKIKAARGKDDSEKSDKERSLVAAVRMFDVAHIEFTAYRAANKPKRICLDYTEQLPPKGK